VITIVAAFLQREWPAKVILGLLSLACLFIDMRSITSSALRLRRVGEVRPDLGSGVRSGESEVRSEKSEVRLG